MVSYPQEFLEAYNLELLKDKISEILPAFVNEFRGSILSLQSQKLLLWPNLSVDLRAQVLEGVEPYADRLLSLDVGDVVDIVVECLAQNKLRSLAKKGWIKANIEAFRQDLETVLTS